MERSCGYVTEKEGGVGRHPNIEVAVDVGCAQRAAAGDDDAGADYGFALHNGRCITRVGICKGILKVVTLHRLKP